MKLLLSTLLFLITANVLAEMPAYLNVKFINYYTNNKGLVPKNKNLPPIVFTTIDNKKKIVFSVDGLELPNRKYSLQDLKCLTKIKCNDEVISKLFDGLYILSQYFENEYYITFDNEIYKMQTDEKTLNENQVGISVISSGVSAKNYFYKYLIQKDPVKSLNKFVNNCFEDQKKESDPSCKVVIEAAKYYQAIYEGKKYLKPNTDKKIFEVISHDAHRSKDYFDISNMKNYEVGKKFVKSMFSFENNSDGFDFTIDKNLIRYEFKESKEFPLVKLSDSNYVKEVWAYHDCDAPKVDGKFRRQGYVVLKNVNNEIVIESLDIKPSFDIAESCKPEH